MKELTCDERIDSNLESRLQDFQEFLESDNCETEKLGNIHNYGLCVDYVEPENDEVSYIRYQLSWGGPSDEFRFYVDYSKRICRIEYMFMDWYDGAKRQLTGANKTLMEDVYEYLCLESILEAQQ